jgi:hypothetical protein
MKELGKMNLRPMTELQQCKNDAASQTFRGLRVAFKGMHRLKYAQYIERVEAGLKSNPRCFFKFANLNRNSSGYPSAMFLGDACARNTQEIADLFGKYFQGVYVRDNSQENFVVDGGVEDSSTVSLIQLKEETVEQDIFVMVNLNYFHFKCFYRNQHS